MCRGLQTKMIGLLAVTFVLTAAAVFAEESWPQLQYDCRRSGNLPDRSVRTPLGLVGAVPLTDAVFTSPVVAHRRVFVVDGAGVVFCLDAESLGVLWKLPTRGGAANCNNTSSPAIAGRYLHFGTMAGSYYVLDTADGKVVKEIRCGEPIFSSPVAAGGRVYFATLGARVYALEPDGTVCWTWDFVSERLDFAGDRFSGEDWAKHKGERVTWQDQFLCSRDLAMYGKTVLLSAGGETIWLEDAGQSATVRAIGLVPKCAGDEKPATFGLSVAEDGTVYRQWHRRDNTGRVEIFRLRDGKVQADYVRGTMTAVDMPQSLGFSAVSLRGEDVYRCRPEEGFGCSKHSGGREQPEYLGGYPAITSPVLLRDAAVYGGLDGRLYVVPLVAGGKVWSFATGFGHPITAPVCVSGGRIYFGCEDGYLYVLGPGGVAPPPSKDLHVDKIRSLLTGKFAGERYDWYTNYGDFQSTNANDHQVERPFKIKWIRRYQGTFKHTPVCGGGRMYTHTAEGQIFAVEQETGRLLWRRFFGGVHASFTSPLYHGERLLVPQAGLKKCSLRCLDAATGELLWEAPFAGSPSWSRQQPPVVHKNLAVYIFGTGRHAAKGSGEVMDWLYSHDNPGYPKDHIPLIVAWDINTGKEVWTKDFSKLGAGGDDAGLCLMDGVLYYSCFFGYAAKRKGVAGPKGVTAAIEPTTGRVLWSSTEHCVTAGCTISAKDGRLYLGGYNAMDSKSGPRHVWCLDAAGGSLIWESEPLIKSINVVTVAEKLIFAFAYGGQGYLLDKATGKILSTFNYGHACTRFTVSEPYVIGPNMDMIDTSDGNKLVSTGPPVDLRDCVGGVVSNGRIFYTSQANGLQVSQVCGAEAASFTAPWEKMASP